MIVINNYRGRIRIGRGCRLLYTAQVFHVFQISEKLFRSTGSSQVGGDNGAWVREVVSPEGLHAE